MNGTKTEQDGGTLYRLENGQDCFEVFAKEGCSRTISTISHGGHCEGIERDLNLFIGGMEGLLMSLAAQNVDISQPQFVAAFADTLEGLEMPQIENVSLEDSTDSMGRPQRILDGQREQYNTVTEQWEPVDDSNDVWFDNYIQMARLLAEMPIGACSITDSQWASLCETMGLEHSQLDDLFNRAQDILEREKQLTFEGGEAKDRWKVYHEFDHEPTIVSTGDDADDESKDIVFGTGTPPLLRLAMAKSLCSMLNTDARTGPSGLRGLYGTTDSNKAGQ